MLWDSLALAARELRKNLFRSTLTILGVVIGVAAVIAIVTLGEGLSAQITSNFASVGATTIIVSPGEERRGPPRPDEAARPFAIEDADAVATIDGVVEVVSVQLVPAMATTEAGERTTVATAATANYVTANGITLAGGRMFDDLTVEQLSSERAAADGLPTPGSFDAPLPAVLGQEAARDLFGLGGDEGRRPPRGPRFLRGENDKPEPVDPGAVLGKRIDLSGTSFEVIGLFDPIDAGLFGLNRNRALLVPLAAAAGGSTEPPDVQTMLVTAASVDRMDAVRREIRQTLRQRRGMKEDQRADFSLRGIDQIIDTIKSTTAIATSVFGAIAAISLLVGGIGIMNIMLVTVTERTREIGLRVAIGAEPRDVLTQFLVEASMLTVLGGVLGILIGLAGGGLGATLLELPFVVNVPVIAGTVALCVVLGVLFGFLPARRAAKLDPIEALRHE